MLVAGDNPERSRTDGAERAETIRNGVGVKRPRSARGSDSVGQVFCVCGKIAKYRLLRKCSHCYMKEWRKRNKKYLEAHRDEANRRAKIFYSKNKDLILKQRRDEYRVNPLVRAKKKESGFRGKYSGNGIKALELAGWECSICGYNRMREVLQIHHRDGNRSNNQLSNLVVLCPTCHAETHQNRDIVRTSGRPEENMRKRHVRNIMSGITSTS